MVAEATVRLKASITHLFGVPTLAMVSPQDELIRVRKNLIQVR